MNRTVKNLVDAFVQHLACKKAQLGLLYKTQRDLEEWLASELCYCLDYLRYTNKFRNLLGEHFEWRFQSPEGRAEGRGGALLIQGKRSNIWIKMGYFLAGWNIVPHLERVGEDIENLASLEGDSKVYVEAVVSRGKWADRTIQDCIMRIQETHGVGFEPYSPFLILTLYNEHQDPLEEHMILRLHYTYIS